MEFNLFCIILPGICHKQNNSEPLNVGRAVIYAQDNTCCCLCQLQNEELTYSTDISMHAAKVYSVLCLHMGFHIIMYNIILYVIAAITQWS